MNTAPHLFWITSRAAGGAALLLASASVVLGLVMGFRGASVGSRKRDLRTVHEALSLCTLGLVAVHGLALLGDSFLKPGIAGIAVPFAGAYRPLWTGLGIIAAYGLFALGLSYYLRDRIGPNRWRRLHRLTALFWVLAVVHTIGAGSDAGELWFLLAAGITILPAALLLGVRWLPGSQPNVSTAEPRKRPARRSSSASLARSRG